VPPTRSAPPDIHAIVEIENVLIEHAYRSALQIDHLNTPLPGIPAPRCKESRPPYQLHSVAVCRSKIVKFHTFRVGHLLAASACEMEMVARHQRHPAVAGKSIDRGRGTLATKVYE
jgi:hypothetical protein